MNRPIAALPLLLAAGLATASDAPGSDTHDQAHTEAARANDLAQEARARAAEGFARAEAHRKTASAQLSDAERARLQAELDAARQRLAETSQKIAELSMQLNDFSPNAFAFQYLNAPKRALIGVVLGQDGDRVTIIGLTPNGPAAKAGIAVGDTLLSINGKAVPQSTGDDAVATARGLFGELEDGEAVTVQVERDGKRLTFTPKAERRAPAEWTQLLSRPLEIDLKQLGELKELRGLEHLPLQIGDAGDGTQRDVQVIIKRERDGNGQGVRHVEKIRVDGGASLNLSTLNPGLGKYFGTDRGILVLEADEKTLPQLRAGDVVQVIDGQPADSVTDVMRAFARKPAGTIVTVEVFRDRQRQVLNVPAPEQRMFFFEAP